MKEQANGLGPALERLYQRRTFGVKPGLDGIQALCEKLDHPEQSFAAIHIAGTNGKGSVAAMLEAWLRHIGVHPGLYTSPHLVRFNERIRLDGQDASDETLAAALERCEVAAAAVYAECGYEPTFFEIATAMAFICIRESGIRLAVIETGLGGRLDATNVVQPLVTVITHIGMDHEQYLGPTLGQIASEKAGIIKPGRPVVCAPQAPEAEDVLRKVAAERNAPFYMAAEHVSVERVGKATQSGQKVRISTQRGLAGQLQLPLAGLHQIENIGVAIAAFELVADSIGCPADMLQLREGILGLRWPARMQYLKHNVLLDSAHNVDGARALVQSLRAQGWRKVIIVTGMCADKNIAAVVAALSGVVAKVYCCAIPGDRAVQPEVLLAYYRQHGIQGIVMEDPCSALLAAEQLADEQGGTVVVAGSIYLAGALLT